MKWHKPVAGLAVLCSIFSLFCCTAGHAAPGYRGREPGANWRQEALGRIEKVRKAPLLVQVVDGRGAALADAQVTVEMQRHAFGFGSAVTARDLVAGSGDGGRYRAVVEKNFNKVVLENDLKWGSWEVGKSSSHPLYRPEYTDRALTWLNERRIGVRGHYVVWGHLEGDWGTSTRKELPREEFRAAIMGHDEEVVRAVGKRVAEWDVVNHPLGWGRGTVADLFGESFYDGVFRQVALWNPQVTRYINEGDVLPHDGRNREGYLLLLSRMLSRGAPIEGIGFMGHFKGEYDLAPPEELLATFDRFARFGVPLQVTEFDVRFGHEMGQPLQLTAAQEALQADYTRDFLIAAFSHPAVAGVVMWGFWEGSHWYPDAALYRKDWTAKPNGKVWEELVSKQWRTREAGATDAKGLFSLRGFHGEYLVKVKCKGKSEVTRRATLGPSGTTARVVVR